MTILVFYPVGNPLDWGRDEFDSDIDEFAFKRLWENREKLGAKFYDMGTKNYGDPFGMLGIHNADEFEDDYNNEDYDGGWWVKCLHIPSDIVKQIKNK